MIEELVCTGSSFIYNSFPLFNFFIFAIVYSDSLFLVNLLIPLLTFQIFFTIITNFFIKLFDNQLS